MTRDGRGPIPVVVGLGGRGTYVVIATYNIHRSESP